MVKVQSEERQKLVLLIIVGALYSLSLAYFFQGLPKVRLTSDFFPRWHASRMLLTTGRNIYDWTNATEISAVTGWPHLHQLGYYYPAYLLIFTAPLSLLPYEVAHTLWVLFGLWCLWLGMFIFAQLPAPPLSLNRLTLLLILVSTAVPVFQHTLYAQFNTLGLLALALSTRALSREQYLWAGFWAGGLLFKPQATLIPLLFFLSWTAFKRERWGFWIGLGLASLGLWAVAQMLEPGWVFSFWSTLGSYEPVRSVMDILVGNPYQSVSLVLLGLTFWLIFRVRELPAQAPAFYGLLVWTICLNALIVPMFGMLHMVLMGPVLVLLLGGFEVTHPRLAPWLWWGMIGLLIAGLLAFSLPLLLTDSTSLQIVAAEAVYRFTLPIICSLAALFLVLTYSYETIRYHPCLQ